MARRCTCGEESPPQDARGALHTAVVDLERVRAAENTAADGVSGWMGPVALHWTVVDHFEHEGTSYVLARRNDVSGVAALSSRERDVVRRTALGNSSKVIAYDLGLADSTVRVLLHRACRKLGVEGTPQLAALWRALAG
jgi:DNA-binding CsgD family transcriptional regulator